jgi:hypothetical protein
VLVRRMADGPAVTDHGTVQPDLEAADVHDL